MTKTGEDLSAAAAKVAAEAAAKASAASVQAYEKVLARAKAAAVTAADATGMFATFRFRGRISPPTDDPSRPGRESAEHLLTEIELLLGTETIDDETLDRAARIVTAEHSWRQGLGVMLADDDVTTLLGITGDRLDALCDGSEVIALTDRAGDRRFPAYQFQDGGTTPALAQAHRLLTQRGRISAWSAASWGRTPHPELEERSPAQWTAEHRDEQRLALVAERDAARLSH